MMNKKTKQTSSPSTPIELQEKKNKKLNLKWF